MANEEAGLESLEGLAFADHDFDGSIADTSVLVEDGHNVESAYDEGVQRTLGDVALCQYRNEGGLRNRAPSEVVDQLVRNRSRADRQQLTEDLVAVKLECLTSQIGHRLPDGQFWPPLIPGVADYWPAVSAIPQVTTGINSSGHEAFISQTFEVHDLPEPKVYLTNDDMRRLTEYLPRAITEKSSPLLLQISTQRWLRLIKYVAAETLSLEQLEVIMAKHMTFAGDGIDKDGEMARRANVSFVHINSQHPELSYAELRTVVTGKLLVGSNAAV